MSASYVSCRQILVYFFCLVNICLSLSLNTERVYNKFSYFWKFQLDIPNSLGEIFFKPMNVWALNVLFAVNGNQGVYKFSKKRINIQRAYCPIDRFFSTYVLQFCKNYQRLIYECGNLVPTYSSPIKANINSHFSLRAKWWLRGGVGGQFPWNLNWSEISLDSPSAKALDP